MVIRRPVDQCGQFLLRLWLDDSVRYGVPDKGFDEAGKFSDVMAV
jgi:hypothetical protein